MDKAVWSGFCGDFEPMLNCLTVRTKSFAREADGTTPLMAACAKGNNMVVQLLLDLQADTLAKDKNGRTAADFAVSHGHQNIVGKVLASSQPPVDEQGKPIFTWDTCEHSGKDLHLDLDKGYLVCTACGLILKENAIVFNTDSDGKIRKTEKVRGADSEYNDWRSEEMDLAELMSSLGIVDNEAAKRRGRENSIWARRDRALAWLDARRRILHGQASHRKSETELEIGHSALETIEEYTEDGEFRIPLKPTMLNQGEITRPMFRGDGKPCAESVGVDEEDLIEIGILGNQYQSTVKWPRCKTLWEFFSLSALQTERRNVLMDTHESWLQKEEELEREIEYEF